MDSVSDWPLHAVIEVVDGKPVLAVKDSEVFVNELPVAEKCVGVGGARADRGVGIAGRSSGVGSFTWRPLTRRLTNCRQQPRVGTERYIAARTSAHASIAFSWSFTS